MRTVLRGCGIAVILGLLAAGSVRIAAEQKQPPPPPKPAATHVMVNASDLKWAAGPPGLPAGAQFAVVEGDPSKPGVPFAIRAKVPDGYKVPPHWHPTDERIVVFSGTLLLGMGDKWNDGAMHALSAGGFANMPKRAHHFAGAKGETVFQVYGTGPFAITYLDPKDDPRKKTTTQ
jgi:uncharacterized protein DUF4437